MSGLAWWAGGALLAAVPLLHWFATRRMLAVSGRFTQLVDRLRLGPSRDETAEMTDAELLAALRQATIEAFGDDAAKDLPALPPAPLERPRPKLTPASHLVFLAALLSGGLVSALSSGDLAFSLVRGSSFTALTGGSLAGGLGVLFAGGLLVGAGTRMASGCTSGHGLCGVSRFQPGSLLATASFFGAGIVASLLLSRWI